MHFRAEFEPSQSNVELLARAPVAEVAALPDVAAFHEHIVAHGVQGKDRLALWHAAHKALMSAFGLSAHEAERRLGLTILNE